MISLPLFLNFSFDFFSRLSSSNLTPKTAEEKAKIAEEVKAKQLAEIEEKKKKREQVDTIECMQKLSPKSTL